MHAQNTTFSFIRPKAIQIPSSSSPKYKELRAYTTVECKLVYYTNMSPNRDPTTKSSGWHVFNDTSHGSCVFCHHLHWVSSLNAIPKIGQGIERLTEWVQRHYMLCLYQTNFAQVSWTTVVSTCSVLSVVVETLRQLQHTTSSSSSPASNCPHFSITFASFSSDTAFSNVTFCFTCSSTCHCPSQEFRV